MTNTFEAAAKVRVAPGHTSWWSSNRLNVHTLSRLYTLSSYLRNVACMGTALVTAYIRRQRLEMYIIIGLLDHYHDYLLRETEMK